MGTCVLEGSTVTNGSLWGAGWADQRRSWHLILYFLFELFTMNTFHTLEEKHKRMLCVEFYTP